jgi:transcriptional regulator with XRE-family HTH domain
MNQMLKRPLLVKKTEMGGLIREFRLLTGLTQEQFGAYLGVTYGTVNRWENGRSGVAESRYENKNLII